MFAIHEDRSMLIPNSVVVAGSAKLIAFRRIAEGS